MGTKTYDSATDMITFSRASGGTALRKVSYGNELVTNGTFDTDTTGWTGILSGFDNLSVVANKMRIQTVDGTALVVYAALASSIPAGSVVKITFDLGDTDNVGQDVRVGFHDTIPTTVNDRNDTFFETTVLGNFDNTSVSKTFVLTSDASYFVIQSNGALCYFDIDNISVKEITFDRATDPLVLDNHSDNIPRIEYDASGAVKGLLIEEARTNLLTYSNDFTNAAWSKTRVSLSSVAISQPDGATATTKLTESTATGIHQLNGANVSGIQTVSASGYFKAAEYSTFQITLGAATSQPYANFDLSAGTVSATGNDGAGTIESVGDGWYRCTMTGLTTTDGSWMVFLTNGNTTSTRGPSYTGDGTSGIYIYGAQLEAASTPSSYIPTTSASATRAADVASIPTSAFGYNSGAGSIYVNGTFLTGDTIVTLGSTTIAADADGVKDYTVTYSADPSATGLVLNQGTYSDVKYYPRILSSAQLSELTT